ncbi:hypothetical protein AAMO2058_000421100 [Amorphochlora amoebiformis]
MAEARGSRCLGNPSWQQTMLRIKNPKDSVKHYEEEYGMRLLDRLDFPDMEFSLYFMASVPKGVETPKPGTDEAHKYLWSYPGVTLELTHNWGTENDEKQAYHPGNAERDGFGHIAFACDDVFTASEGLETRGVQFKKRPNEGRMKGLAFAYDPDKYWVEIVKNPCSAQERGFGEFVLGQTMVRVKDPKASLKFYQDHMGMTLVREKHFNDFSLYFLATLPKGATEPDPSQPVLELTHNHGTETNPEFSYSNGNENGKKGFGHVGFLVDDVFSKCEELQKAGYKMKKGPNDGSMKGLAFALDPDGYWVEIIKRDPTSQLLDIVKKLNIASQIIVIIENSLLASVFLKKSISLERTSNRVTRTITREMASVFARVCLVLLLVRSIAESEDGKVSDVTENGEHDVDVEISASGQAKLEKVKFLNSAGIPLDIYWLNPYTQENVIMIPEVMPGQSYEIQTVPGHTFQWMQRGQNSPETVHYRVTIKDLTDVYEVTMAKIWKYASFRCSDRLDSYVCKQKANSGQCERSPGWMIHNCPLACGLCHMRDPFIRCNRTRLRTEKGVWKPGDMNSRFEFITKNFQQYSPKILSHPPEGPWIIQLDDFVNKKEAERLIELNVGRMQRSVDQGSETKEGQVSWKLSEDRTSSSSWCILACERDERVTALRERIEDLTGIPQGYYEGFQAYT